jgi:hypothetical protein
VKAEHVLLACLVAVSATLAISVASSIAFLLRLKRYEHDVYLSLGSPLKPRCGQVANLRRSAAVLLFLKNKSHHSLSDERSVRLGDRMVLINRFLLGVIVLVCAITGYVILFVKP